MMKLSLFMIVLTGVPGIAQEISSAFISKTPLTADRFIGVDHFANVYYITDNVLYKKEKETIVRYTNLQLGAIGNVDILNPLEITVFYPDFNTVIKLDNTLNEILKIDFTTLNSFSNIQYATIANDNHLWVFNIHQQQLALFNYQNQEFFMLHQPIYEVVIDQHSNYNFCWLLTGKALLKYNSYGSLLSVTVLEGYERFSQNSNNIVLKKANKLFYKEESSKQVIPIPLTATLPVKDFYITGNYLYIYDSKNICQYKLNLRKNE